MNCLTYAVGKWLKEGGYLIVRRSRIGDQFGVKSNWHPIRWIPHFMHRSKTHEVTQYVPTPRQVEIDIERGVLKTLLMGWLTLWRGGGHIIGDDPK
jgi:hypothetical protein